MILRRSIVSMLLSLLGLAVAAPLAAAGHHVTATAESRTGPLVRTEYTVQAGAHPLDRFKMIRLAKDVPPAALGEAILFLPPLGTTFSFYEQRDEHGGFGTSIAEYFALRGYDVYGISPRFEGIPAGTCEAGVLDCSVMAGWNLASMVADTAFARAQIELLHPGVPVVLGGASLGSILAIAVLDAAPGDYDGAILWEGMLYSEDPAVIALNQAYCAGLEAQLAAGVVYDAVGGGVLRQVARYAELAPGGLTPIPLFPPSLTNHQTLVAALSTPTPGPVSMPVPSYIQMNGSLAEDRLFFASEGRIFPGIHRFNDYAPNVLVRDVSCSLAGVDDQYVDNLGSFTGPILAIGGGRGFGAYMQDQLDLFGSTDVTFLLEPDFGHIDHFMTRHHRNVVERPILHWLQQIFP